MKSKLTSRRLAVALATLLMLGSLVGCAKQESDTSPKLSYASEGVTVVDDENALNKAVQEMKEKTKEGAMSLWFKNNAYSADGKNFDCFIGNSQANSYDMFIAIYADDAFTDQLYLSGLIRPGERFEKVTLERALEKGTHTVYVAYTQVESDLQTIHAQSLITMEFVVQ